jgi:hypothetical protein
MTQPEINLTLTIEDTNQILLALQELPAKVCNPLSQKIHEQAREQLKPESAEQE